MKEYDDFEERRHTTTTKTYTRRKIRNCDDEYWRGSSFHEGENEILGNTHIKSVYKLYLLKPF